MAAITITCNSDHLNNVILLSKQVLVGLEGQAFDAAAISISALGKLLAAEMAKPVPYVAPVEAPVP